MNYPERKSVLYTIKTVKWDATFRLKQATARETNHMLDMYKVIKDGEIQEKIYYNWEINKVYINLLHESLLYCNPEKERESIMELVIDNIDKYQNDIFDAVHVIKESVYKNFNIPKQKESKKQIFSNPHLISELTLIPIDQLDDRLTFEQKQWRVDKMLWDYCNSFKEWEAVNKKVYSEQKKDEYAQIAKEIQEDFNYLNK